MASQPSLTYAYEAAVDLEERTGILESDDSLGYSLIESPHVTSDYSLENIARFPIPFMIGLGRAATSYIDLSRNHEPKPWPHGNIEEVEIGKQLRPVMVTQPNPEHCTDPKNAINEVMFMGLTELNEGSHRFYHEDLARARPDRRIISIMTPGISSHGPVLNPLEGLTRLLDTTAEEYLQALPNLTHDGIINIYGTSLGSVISFHLAALNLARNNHQKLNIGVIKLASPAAGARDVHEHEKFNIYDASNQKYIRDVRNRFFLHMPQDAARMALRHPEKAGECMSVALIYSMDIGKHIPRLFTLIGNLRSAQQGIDWETMKYVTRSHHLSVVAGKDDPLMKEQLPQYVKLKELSPNVEIRILKDYGHALTLDSESVVRHFNEMEQAA